MMRTFVTIFTVVVHLLLADAVTKELAVARLKGAAAVVVWPNLFDLAYVENRGCAWGMLQNHIWLLAVLAILALGFVFWHRADFFHTAARGWRRWCGRVAECFLYAGILGNLVDRVFRGYVIDFLDFHWGVHHFPCFNLADTYITCAAILLIVLSLWAPKKEK